MKRLIGTVTVLGVMVGVLSGAIAAEIHLQKEIESIPAKITELYNCGAWANSETAGFYRVVYVESYNGCSLLFVQWIQEFTRQDPTRHILHTLSIPEFNLNDHIELMFDKPTCIETAEGIKFNIVAYSGHDDRKRTFDLQVYHEFGKYSIKELREP